MLPIFWPEVVVGLEAADLEDQLRVAEVDQGDHRVGRLALVRVAEPAAEADDALGQGGAGDHPAGDVHLVDPLVADVAVAEIPEPVPVVVDVVGVERVLRRRAEPEVVVDGRGCFGVRLDADALAGLVAEPARDEQLAVLARLDDLGHPGPRLHAPALRAVLDDPVVLPRGLDGDAAFVDVVAARLLDVDVLARLAAPDGDQRVPVVRRGDRDRVEVLVVEGAADVLDRLGRAAAALGDRLDVLRVRRGVGVDQVGDLDPLHLAERADVRAAPAVQAGDADADGVVGADDPARRFRPADRKAGSDAGRDHRMIQELTTIQT